MTTNNATNTPFPIAIAVGGTGQTGQTAAFNALSPLTTKGDIIAFDGTNNVRVSVGSNGKILTSSSGTSSGVAYATTTANPTLLSSSTVVTASQVLAMKATPIQVLAAQGAGVYAVPLLAILKMTYGGNNPFTNAQNIALKYTTGGGATAIGTMTGAGFIDASANKYQLGEIAVTSLTVALAENSAIFVYNAGASEITGNASLDNSLTVVLLYKILTL